MNKYAPFFVIVAASLWGIDAIVLRPYLYNLSVPLVVFIESAIVALLLSPILFKRINDIKSLDKKDLLIFFGVAMFGGAIGTMAITKALFYVNYVNLSIVVLIQKLQPVFAITLASLFLHERPPRQFFLWAGLAIVGAYLMTFGVNIPNLDTGDKTVVAALFALLASFSFGSSTVLSKRALKNVGFELGTYIRFTITAIIMFFIVLSFGELNSINKISENQAIIFIFIALITGGPAIFLYYYGLKHISASVSTICELAFPLTAVLLEYFIRGNILGSVQWVGVLILLFSIVRVSILKASMK
ncbi:MAG: EamA family transporter [Calditrichia bacterium]|nr:EamA family transporter [Calditrichia bacterium]